MYISAGQPPSPYVMYKFYTYPDHDMPILSPTISPEFNDTHHFGVTRGSPLEQYLSNNVSCSIWYPLHVHVHVPIILTLKLCMKM